MGKTNLWYSGYLASLGEVGVVMQRRHKDSF